MYQGLIKKLRNRFGILFQHRSAFLIMFLFVYMVTHVGYVLTFGETYSFATWSVLIVLSIGATYFLLFEGSDLFLKHIYGVLEFALNREKEISNNNVNVSKNLFDEDGPHSIYFPNAPKGEWADDVSDLENDLEQKAHKEGALISQEALKIISSHNEKALDVMLELIYKARSKYPLFDGWIILNKEHVESLLNEVVDESAQNTIIPKVPVNLPTATVEGYSRTSTTAFLNLLFDKGVDEVFTFVSKKGEVDGTHKLITDTILVLDDIHKHREARPHFCDQYTLSKTKHLRDEELEDLISILVSGMDYKYTDNETALKIALIRASQYIKISFGK